MSHQRKNNTHAICRRKPAKLKRTLATFNHDELKYLAWNKSPLAAELVRQYLPKRYVQIVLKLLDLSNAAGLFDGEGSITLAKTFRDCGNGFNFRLRVQIPQNCLETLRTFQERVGESGRLGRLKHRDSYTRPIHLLVFDGAHAYNVLKKLRPFLVRKADEADVVFSYFDTAHPGRHFGPAGVPAEVWEIRERCHQALRCLK